MILQADSSVKTEDELKSQSAPTEDHWSILAGLRFALASVVVAYHFYAHLRVSDWFTSLRSFSAYAAVFGFFIISGYSIAHSITAKREGFLWRRAQRIFPTYLAALAISLVPFYLFNLHVVTPGNSHVAAPLWPEVVASLFMMQGFFGPIMLNDGPIWSLAIEWWYYVAAPLFIRFEKRIILSLLAISALFYFGGSVPVLSGVQNLGAITTLTTYLWPWLLGWCLYRYRGDKWLLPFCIICGPLFMLFKDPPGGFLAPLTVSATALLIYFSKDWRLPAKPMSVVLKYLGELSYPLYLIHMPVLYYVYLLTHRTNPVLYLFCAILASIAVYHLVEKPLRSKKRMAVHKVNAKPIPATM